MEIKDTTFILPFFSKRLKPFFFVVLLLNGMFSPSKHLILNNFSIPWPTVYLSYISPEDKHMIRLLWNPFSLQKMSLNESLLGSYIFLIRCWYSIQKYYLSFNGIYSYWTLYKIAIVCVIRAFYWNNTGSLSASSWFVC